MAKRLISLLLMLSMILALAACAGDPGASAEPSDSGASGSAEPSPSGSDAPDDKEEAGVYHNGLYGLTVTVPEGWIVMGRDQKNLTERPAQSAAFESLALTDYDDGLGQGIYLIELWSRERSEDKEHASIMLYMERYENIPKSEYFTAVADNYQGDFQGYTSVLMEQKDITLDGETYRFLKYRTTIPKGEDSYFEEYYIREAAEYTYFVACVTYWEGNELSEAAAKQAVESSFAFSATGNS